MNISHRFMTIRQHGQDRLARCTILWQLEWRNNDWELQYGVSYCSPEDSFNRVKGRVEALLEGWFETPTPELRAAAEFAIRNANEDEFLNMMYDARKHKPTVRHSIPWSGSEPEFAILTRTEQLEALLPHIMASRPSSWRKAQWVPERVKGMGGCGSRLPEATTSK